MNTMTVAENKSMHIRLAATTALAMRTAATELAAATGQPLMTDDQRLAALVDHWERTKGDAYGLRTRTAYAGNN